MKLKSRRHSLNVDVKWRALLPRILKVPQFKSRPWHRLPSLRNFVLSSAPPVKTPRQHLHLRHNRFLPSPFQFTNNHIIWDTESVVKCLTFLYNSTPLHLSRPNLTRWQGTYLGRFWTPDYPPKYKNLQNCGFAYWWITIRPSVLIFSCHVDEWL
jgi:hypothetical protein